MRKLYLASAASALAVAIAAMAATVFIKEQRPIVELLYTVEVEQCIGYGQAVSNPTSITISNLQILHNYMEVSSSEINTDRVKAFAEIGNGYGITNRDFHSTCKPVIQVVMLEAMALGMDGYIFHDH